MADSELALILSKRSKIIEDEEQKIAQETDLSKTQNIGEPGTDLKPSNLPSKPTLLPKPKPDPNKPTLTQKTTRQENAETRGSFASRNPKLAGPPKPPRLLAKPDLDTPESKIQVEAAGSTKSSNISAPPSTVADGRTNENWKPIFRVWNPFAEFREIPRKEIQKYLQEFQKYDKNCDKHLDLEELKQMMEKIGCPQTHLGLKAIMREVDEDRDNKISFKEFLLIFKKARNNEMPVESGLNDLYKRIDEFDVDKEGVWKAKDFFEAKISSLTQTGTFEDEIKKEITERKEAQEERKRKKAAFSETVKMFQQT